MTVNSKKPVTGPTLSDGVKIDWPFDFKITDASQMTLVIRDLTSLAEEIVTSGLTVDDAYINNDTGGYVRYSPGGDAVPDGKAVFAVRQVPYSQPVRIGNQGPFWPETHENAFDNLSMQVQQVKEAQDRSLGVGVGEEPPSVQAIFEAEANAINSANSSIAAKNASEAARDISVSAKDTAVAAKDTAVTAKNDAVAARDTAVAAKDTAVAAAASASGSAISASDDAAAAHADALSASGSATTAGNAAATAVAASGVAVDAKDDAEAAKVAAEAAAAAAQPAPIGSVIMIFGDDTSVAPGYLLMNGFSVTNTYPDLRAHGLAHGWPVDGNGDPICPNMGGKFPRGWLPGQVIDSGRVFGTTQNDAIRNITGSLTGILNNPGGTQAGGALQTDTPANANLTGGGSVRSTNNLTFDASLVVPTADDNRPYNETFTFWIKAYAADTDPGAIDLNGVVNDTNALKARVAALEGKKGTTGVLALSTAQFDITGIPTDARHIKIKIAEASFSASAQLNIQVGTPSGVEATGYKSSGAGQSSTGTSTASYTSGFQVAQYSSSTGPYTGVMELDRLGSTNNWVARAQAKLADSAGALGGVAGYKSLSGLLDRIRITSPAGTATLSGSIEIEWEK